MRAVTRREPEWTDEDRGLVLALLAERDETCPGCRQPMDECRDPKTAGSWSPVQQVCQACVVQEAASDNAGEGGKRQRGLYLGVTRYEGASSG